jgi:hypothetical protein
VTVVPFPSAVERSPHLAGEAVCIGCGYEWASVAPTGTWQLECPSCGTMKGVWRYPVGGAEGDMVFRCACGCEALTAYKRGALFHLKCMSCGTEQTAAIFGE